MKADNFSNQKPADLCDSILFLTSCQLDGELLEVDREKMEAHLGGCPSCSAKKEKMDQLDGLAKKAAELWERRDFFQERQALDRVILASFTPVKTRRKFSLLKLLPLCAASLMLLIYLSFSYPPKGDHHPVYWLKSKAPIQLLTQREQADWVLVDHPISQGIQEGALIQADQRNEIQIGRKLLIVLHKGARIRVLKGPTIRIERGMVLVRTRGQKDLKIYTAGGEISLGKGSAMVSVKKVSPQAFGSMVKTQMAQVTALDGPLKIYNQYGNLTLAPGGKALLNPSTPPCLNFVLEKNSLLLAQARQKWSKTRLTASLFEQVEQCKKIYQNVRWDTINIYGSSPIEFVENLNRCLFGKPYVLILSKTPSSPLEFKSTRSTSLPEIIRWLEKKLQFHHYFSPEILLLGKAKDLRKYCLKNYPLLFQPAKMPSLGKVGRQKIQWNRECSLSDFSRTVYGQTRLKIYLAEDLPQVIFPQKKQSPSSITLEKYLQKLSDTLQIAWYPSSGPRDTLYLFRTGLSSRIENFKARIQKEFQTFQIKIIGKITEGGEKKIALQTKWGRGIYGPGSVVGKVRILKISDFQVIFVYRGFLFSRAL